MKPQILHGSATNISRKKLSEIKQKFDPNSVVVFEEGTDAQTILTNLKSQSLFDGERLVILENPSESFVLNYTLYPIPCTLVLWFDHEVDVSKWPGFDVLFFPESKEISVFPFLDLLAAGDKRAFLEISKLKKANFDIFYMITMVYYLLRNLAVTPLNAQDFVKRKLAKQRASFDIGKIQNLYKDILEIEFKLKSGMMDKPQAEFILVNRFLDYM